MRPLDIAGCTFGRLVALSRHAGRRWLCRCVCGRTTLVALSNLRSGHTLSCGCYREEVRSECHTVHGEFQNGRTPEIRCIEGIKRRCLNPRSTDYHLYGGRGIKVCQRWLDDPMNFILDMGRKPDRSFSIDRIDVNGDYEPKNCRWADPLTQARNKRKREVV